MRPLLFNTERICMTVKLFKESLPPFLYLPWEGETFLARVPSKVSLLSEELFECLIIIEIWIEAIGCIYDIF